jgi:S1-C subfamily serine protease
MQNRIIMSVLLTILSSPPSRADAQIVESETFSSPFQRITLRSIVRIHDQTDGVAGTGFVIGRDAQERLYIMTCAHVADRGHRLEIDFHPHGSIDLTRDIELVAYDETRDMAMLRVPRGFDVLPIPFSASGRMPNGNYETFVAGFPNGERTCKVTRAASRSVESSRDNLYLEDRVGPGASGSPVIVRQGEARYTAIGVYWGHTPTQGIATVDLQGFLKDNSLEFLQQDVTDDDLSSAISTTLSVILEELADR